MRYSSKRIKTIEGILSHSRKKLGFYPISFSLSQAGRLLGICCEGAKHFNLPRDNSNKTWRQPYSVHESSSEEPCYRCAGGSFPAADVWHVVSLRHGSERSALRVLWPGLLRLLLHPIVGISHWGTERDETLRRPVPAGTSSFPAAPPPCLLFSVLVGETSSYSYKPKLVFEREWIICVWCVLLLTI